MPRAPLLVHDSPTVAAWLAWLKTTAFDWNVVVKIKKLTSFPSNPVKQ